MPQQIYVNLPVKDLPRAKAFFAALGFGFNAEFTDDKAACLVIGDNIYAMLLVEEFFQTFTAKPVADAHRTTECLICISRESRAAVDEIVAKAKAAGGAVPRTPQDHGFMVQHGFEDLDGHIWEVVWMKDERAAA